MTSNNNTAVITMLLPLIIFAIFVTRIQIIIVVNHCRLHHQLKTYAYKHRKKEKLYMALLENNLI